MNEKRYKKLLKEKNKKLKQIDELTLEIELINDEMNQITLNYIDIKVKELNLSLYDLEKILEDKREKKEDEEI